jgi:hypothetical protein
MKTGTLHTPDNKINLERQQAIEIIEELLATIYAMRVSLKINHTETEIKAYDYLKGIK